MPSQSDKQDSCSSPGKTTKRVREDVALVISSVPNYAATASTTTTTSAAIPTAAIDPTNLNSDGSSRMFFGTNNEHGTMNSSDDRNFRTRFALPSLTGLFPAQHLRVMPYAPLEDLVHEATTNPSLMFPSLATESCASLVTPANSVFTPHDSIATIAEFASQEMDCVPSPSASQNVISSDVVSKTAGGIPPKEVGESSRVEWIGSGSLPQTSSGGSEEVVEAMKDADAVTLDADFVKSMSQKVDPVFGSSCIASSPAGRDMGNSTGGDGSDGGEGDDSGATVKPLASLPAVMELLRFGKEASAGSVMDNAAGGDGGDSSATVKPLASLPTMTEPLRFGKGSASSNATASVCAQLWGHPGCSSKTNTFSDSSNMVKMLFSNWSSIVTIVLGFDPNLSSSYSIASPRTLSSVHLLDNFTTDLILNCSDHMINHFVNAIINQLNVAIQSSSDLLLLVQEIDYADPEAIARYLECGDVGVAFLVGKRFLNSVVRILALEHSRIKNRFLEMQQARQAAAAQTGTCHKYMCVSTV